MPRKKAAERKRAAAGASPLRAFVRAVERDHVKGTATEHTFRPALKELLESLEVGVLATNEPKREACGAPDFVVSRSRGLVEFTVGHLEAKVLDASLEAIERDASLAKPRTRDGRQLRRYLAALPNLVLTNHLEFRWYVGGELRTSARLASLAGGGRIAVEDDGAATELLGAFLKHEPEPISSARELAERLAQLAQFVRDVIVRAFDQGYASESMSGWRDAFEEVLIPGLKVPEFADMFAQTLTYGLFAARCNHSDGAPFQRANAATEIPKTNPFLRRLFSMITAVEFDEEPFSGFVDDIAQTLAFADMDAILADFGRKDGRVDPVVHFYETFLTSYDPRLRERRGVYYTPTPVVSYIIRSVDQLLKRRFDCSAGLADTEKVEYVVSENGKKRTEQSHRVLILDPACGTGTFLYEVVDLIRSQFIERGQAGRWSGYVRNHLLPRLFAFELLMAPYAVAHFKLALQLAALDLDGDDLRSKWRYDFSSDERLGIYLTNTLEQAVKHSEMLIARFISEEANAAASIKRDLPIMVIVGNPPYSVASYNRGEWIDEIMEEYKKNVRAEESQIQALSNDYIKFIRFSQWRIDRTQQGVLGFITGHGYIDGPLARDMRASLMKSFDEIRILNLHGSVRRASASTAGTRDEPVFEIQQGTAIILAAKGGSGKEGVYYAERVGTLKEKFDYLSSNDITTTKWTELHPSPPNYYFTPRSTNLEDEYDSFVSITEVFGTGNRKKDKEKLWATGFSSQQDEFAIAFTDEELAERIGKLARIIHDGRMI